MFKFLRLGAILTALAIGAYAVFAATTVSVPWPFTWADPPPPPATIVLENSQPPVGDQLGLTAVGTVNMRNTSATVAINGITMALVILDPPQTVAFSCPGGCASLAGGQTKTITVTITRNGAPAGTKLPNLEVTWP